MTNLTSVSTYGWFNGATAGQDVADALEPIATYGWWVSVITLGDPDRIFFDLYIKEDHVSGLYVKKSAIWPLER